MIHLILTILILKKSYNNASYSHSKNKLNCTYYETKAQLDGKINIDKI